MKFDLIIIGAGPSGLSLACALDKTNLKIAVIEKNSKSIFSYPKNDGRDIAITHRSKNILKKIGVWKYIKSETISLVKEARVLNGNSSNFLHFDHTKTIENSLGYLISNQIIRKAIYKKIQKQKNIKFFPKNEVTKVFSNSLSSKIFLKNGKIFEAKLTIIADGRLSKIRDNVGIYANKTNFETKMTVFRMKHSLSNYGIASEYFHYDQTLAVLPIKKNLSSIVVTLSNEKSKKLLKMNKFEINKKMEKDLKEKFGKMNLIGKKYTYPMLTVYSDEFIRDRFILVGDAAIGMHPVTAHGFNLNLRGIDILQNEIKKALMNNIDIGSLSLLKSYEKKFRKVSLPIYLATNAIVRLYTDQKPVSKIARKSFLILANLMKPAKNAIIDNLLIKNS